MNLLRIKISIMKKLIYILTIFIIVSACATTREGTTSMAGNRKERKLAERELIKNAVESRRFIVKFEEHYPSFGGIINLFPRSNYIVVDGEKAIISAAYFGRQYDALPIAGFNVHGKTLNYESQYKDNKGMYSIKMEVGNGKNTFDVDLAISDDGNCTAYISNIKTDYVRYRGYVVPIKSKEQDQENNKGKNPFTDDNVI